LTGGNLLAKERITLTIDNDFLKWIDKKINEKIFANRSHAFEYLVAQAKLNKNKNKSSKKG